MTHQLSGKRLFIVDAFCGANADTRLSVRFITEVARQAHFVKNMFIRPTDEELVGFKPDFIVMNGAKCTNPQWKEQGLNSENFVAFNLTERIQLIGGTVRRRNEKGMFSVMNYLLPLKVSPQCTVPPTWVKKAMSRSSSAFPVPENHSVHRPETSSDWR